MMSIYSFAFSTLLVIGSSVSTQLANITESEFSQKENKQVLVAGKTNKQKPCPNKAKPKQIVHRGSGRVEPEPPKSPSTTSIDSQFYSNQIDLFLAEKSDADKDQPGGDARRAHRGSGRLEDEKDNNQNSSNSQIIAESPSQDNNKEAHRGSGRLEA
ncbi:hypothetical protein NG798_15745 [Ancylothrix sp. C2]|uniref:hypothetical protein n=1 Tax=Ancylothrix sp. D3o TaxID=2953691 RepID=UPI0021BB4A9B|nr:hypothetical protein [Ancylothrix sp. D3o]MCT7951253.1 hypothetical protein [Ancylothrix sp. D3o]